MLMWIGAFVLLLGLISLILGARLKSIVEDGIVEKVEEKLTVSASSEQDSKFMTTVQPYTYYFFNVTNAKQVVENGSIPIVQQIRVKCTRTQQKYDFTVNENTYGYREFAIYEPLNEADFDIPLITLNPVYLGVAIGQGAGELGFQSALTPAAFRQLVPILTGPDGLLKKYQGTVIPVYLLTLWQACMQLPVPPLNDTTGAACITQWGLQNQLGGKRISEVDPGYAKFTGWELPTPIPSATANALFLLTNNGSLTSTTGVARWALLGMYAEEVKKGNASAIPLYNATLGALIADVAELTEAHATTVLQYLAGQLLFNSTQNVVYYFDVIKSKLLETFPEVAQAESWHDLGLLQFSRSTLSQSLGMNHSLFTPNPAFEFSAYQLDTLDTDPKSMANLTLNETQNLLEYFSVDGSVSYFGLTLQAIFDGSRPIEDLQEFEFLGVRLDTVVNIATFLLHYVPVTFVLKAKLGLGTVLPDGTHPSNTGMFTKRTVREVLYGYDDPLLTLLGQDPRYNGLIGPLLLNVSEAQAWDALTNKTGKLDTFPSRDMTHFGEYREWQGVEEFHNATDIQKKCASIAWKRDADASACIIWKNTEVVTGRSHHTQFVPFQDERNPEPVRVFSSNLLREVIFDFSEHVEVKGISLRRYRLRASELKNPEDAGSPAAANRSTNYRVAVSGFQDMSTGYEMSPINFGLPRHYGNLAEQDKILGLTDADWNETSNVGALETFLDVEPLTGKVMQARQRLQFNLRLDESRLNGMYQTMYTAKGYVMFPIMWIEEGDTISDADAESFRSNVLDTRSVAKSWSIALIILGFLFMVVGLAVLCKGWRVYRIKDANETMPLRAGEKKTFI